MLYFIANYLLTPWLTIKHAVCNVVKVLIPTHVHHVVHINADTSIATIIHPRSFWSHDTDVIMHLSSKDRETGYYYIRTWDGLQRTSHEYFLSASHLRAALGLTSLANWWTMHDYGVQVMLHGYMSYRRNSIDSGSLFAILDDANNDLTHHVHHKLLRSLELNTNITTKSLTRLLRYLGHMPHERAIAKVIDFDLNERILAPDDFLFAPKN